MPTKVSALTEETVVSNDDLFLLTKYISPGVYQSKKITYANFKSAINAFVKDGNSFGSAPKIGTIDAFGMEIITNNVTRVVIGVNGGVTIDTSATGTSALNCFSNGFPAASFVQNEASGATAASESTTLSENAANVAKIIRSRNDLNNAVNYPLQLVHDLKTLNGANGIGVGQRFSASTDSSSDREIAAMYAYWITATDATRTGAVVFKTTSLGSEADRLGIYGESMIFNSSLANFGGGRGVFQIGNAITVPVLNATNGGIVYVEGGALKYRGSAGTITTVGPA